MRLGGEGLRLITLFYMVSTMFMGLIGGIGLGLWIVMFAPVEYVAVGAFLYLVVLFLIAWGILRRTSTTKKLESGLSDERLHSYEAYENFDAFGSHNRSSDAASPNQRIEPTA